MSISKQFYKSDGFVRVLTLVILCLFLFLARSMLNLVLFTFIFTFLMGRLQGIVTVAIRKVFPINTRVVAVALYLILLGLLSTVVYTYLPVITMQITQLVNLGLFYYKNPPDIKAVEYLISLAKLYESPSDIEQRITLLLDYTRISVQVIAQVLLALLLSLFFLLEKARIVKFAVQFKYGKFGRFFEELGHFGHKFVNSFGKVIEVQFLIAFVNAILSVIVLSIMDFPQLIGIGIMIFCLGLIPVAGVLVSLIPLCTIAYSIGGGVNVIVVVVMIMVIHALESYILNPKFMSNKTNLPAFFTFLVLIFSEHFMGAWGLIIGIPIFMFILDLLEVRDVDEDLTKINNAKT